MCGLSNSEANKYGEISIRMSLINSIASLSLKKKVGMKIILVTSIRYKSQFKGNSDYVLFIHSVYLIKPL